MAHAAGTATGARGTRYSRGASHRVSLCTTRAKRQAPGDFSRVVPECLSDAMS
jgi:hypothetical protein